MDNYRFHTDDPRRVARSDAIIHVPAVIEEPPTVLLIEDSPDDERLALRALRSCGLPVSVRVAHDGRRALGALGLDAAKTVEEPRPPDLVISDLKMPGLNGDEVLRLARGDERLRDVPYVLLSSSAEPSDVQRCLGLGASAYCVKPIGYEEYLECVGAIARKWLKGDDAEPPCALDAPRGTETRSPEVP